MNSSWSNRYLVLKISSSQTEMDDILTTLILPFYDIPIKESRYLANNSNITVL
jgi:hypothetical protein